MTPMKFVFYFSLVALLALSSCNNDDDNTIPEISIEEQNTQDDASIQVFLDSYYLDDLGRLIAFDEDDSSDDDETPIRDHATALSDGVYYIVNPDIVAAGPSVTDVDTQTILLNYDFKTFYSGTNEEGEYLVTNYSTLVNTVNTTGLPSWNIPFFREDLEEDSSLTESFYEMEGFQEAIKHFQATEKEFEEPYVFQGAIIVPSRMAYARDSNVYSLYNAIAVISFELYDVKDDE